jgi:hypothetical protein
LVPNFIILQHLHIVNDGCMVKFFFQLFYCFNISPCLLPHNLQHIDHV